MLSHRKARKYERYELTAFGVSVLEGEKIEVFCHVRSLERTVDISWERTVVVEISVWNKLSVRFWQDFIMMMLRDSWQSRPGTQEV